MRRIPKATYQTPEHIEARIAERMNDALSFPPDSAEHRALMQEISKLKIYAEAKRWIARPASKQNGKPVAAVDLESKHDAIRGAESLARRLDRTVRVGAQPA
jgi:hypothetical protein